MSQSPPTRTGAAVALEASAQYLTFLLADGVFAMELGGPEVAKSLDGSQGRQPGRWRRRASRQHGIAPAVPASGLAVDVRAPGRIAARTPHQG